MGQKWQPSRIDHSLYNITKIVKNAWIKKKNGPARSG